ncbi:MAG: hypothetical protein BEN18_07975 [Epulopiscium sp. Nuni2H_MBin001]|nr:MAG: hypothetical protein BEN18_07975 [Epulopiscium sp. Nuni2H_MBin001]
MGQNILKGAMILSIASVISKILGMLYKIPITNIIGDQGNAIYASAYNMYILLITFSAIGMPTAISKLVSERREIGAFREAHRVYKVALIYSVLLAFILASTLWFGAEFIATFMQNELLVMPLKALAPTSVIVTIMAVTRGYLQGTGDMFPTAISQVVEQIFNAIFSVVLAYMFISYGVVEAATGSTLGTGLGAVFGLITLLIIYVRKKINTTDTVASKFDNESPTIILKAILWTVIPIVLSTSIFAIITNIDTLMLNTMLPNLVEQLISHNRYDLVNVTGAIDMTTTQIVDSLAGQYLGKYLTLINVPVALILTIGMAATPAIAAEMAKEDFEAARAKTYMILKIGSLLAVPSAVGLTLYAKPIMELIYSHSPDGHRLIAYGSIAIIFIALAQLTTSVLQGMGRQYIPTRNALIACIIKIIVNFIFLQIPIINIYAVVHSTTICYVVFAMLNINYLSKNIELKLDWKNIVFRPVLASAIMGAGSFVVYYGLFLTTGMSSVALIVAIIIAIILYGIFGILVGAISVEDLRNIPGGRRFISVANKFSSN